MSVAKYLVVSELPPKIIHDNHPIRIPWHWTCNADEVRVDVSWDPKKTKIVSAKLRARVYSDSGAVYFNYFLNDNNVLGFTWEEWEPGQWREGEKDVTIHIRNGVNYFKAQACKHYWYPLEPTVWVTGVLIVTFEGEPPGVGTPTKPFPWQDYAKAGVAGAVIGGSLATIYSLMARPERTWMEHAQLALVGALAGTGLGLGIRYLIGG